MHHFNQLSLSAGRCLTLWKAVLHIPKVTDCYLQARALPGRLKHSGYTEEWDYAISGAGFSVDPHEGGRGQPLSQGYEKDQIQLSIRNYGILALS